MLTQKETEAIRARAKTASGEIAWSHFPNIVKDFYRKDIPDLLKENKNLRDGIQDVIDLIRDDADVSTLIIEKWLERTLKGE